MQIMPKKQHMYNIKKKAISPVVATVALVMITLAAAVFIAGFVVPFVRDNLNEGTECVGYEEYFSFYEEFEYNCYRVEAGNYLIAISIEANSISEEKLNNLDGMRLQFMAEGESNGIEIKDGEATNASRIRMLKTSESTLSVPQKGEVKTYVYNSDSQYEKVEVYPLLKNGRMCEKSGEIKLILCGSSVPLVLT